MMSLAKMIVEVISSRDIETQAQLIHLCSSIHRFIKIYNILRLKMFIKTDKGKSTNSTHLHPRIAQHFLHVGERTNVIQQSRALHALVNQVLLCT